MRWPGDDVLHDRAVEQAAEGAHVRDLRVILEPDRVREAAPGECQLGRDRARDRHLERRHRRPQLVLVLLEVERLPLQLAEDRLGRSVGREAVEHREDLERVDAGHPLHRDPGAALRDGRHVGRRRREQQARPRGTSAPTARVRAAPTAPRRPCRCSGSRP